jgi:hypothetical protein
MTVPTFTATIYVGLKQNYDGVIKSFDEVETLIQKWVDKLGMCVTVTPTKFVYTGGSEPGLIVGFINYPRFPTEEWKIQENALNLAQILLRECKQMRVSVVFPHKTIMLSNEMEIIAYDLKSKDKCSCTGIRRGYFAGNLAYCEGCNKPI